MYAIGNSLPDEIVHEILLDALSIPDADFSHNNHTAAPFTSVAESPSAYLLVNKSWLRVATPLLYEVVVLRSKAQAKALASALTKNSELARFIKKLRVEGGFGAPMHTILKLAFNIAHVFLTLEIWSPDTTDGLCTGLELISPSRLILQRSSRKPPDNRSVRKLVDALCAAVKKWDKLTVLDLPTRDSYADPSPSASLISVVNAVAAAGMLESVVVPGSSSIKFVYKKFGSKCPLKTIVSKTPLHLLPGKTLSSSFDPSIVALLVFPEPYPNRSAPTTMEIASPFDPTYAPMKGVPQATQDAVWDRILYFAFRVPERATRRLSLKNSDCGLLRVCKRFHRLGLPHLYVHLVAERPPGTFSITAFLARRLQIPVLSFDTQATGHRWQIYSQLIELYGSTLQSLNVQEFFRGEGTIPIETFASLPVLRKLSWTYHASIVGDAQTASSSVSGMLPALEELDIQGCNDKFLDLLVRMRLPALRFVSVLECRRPGFGSDPGALRPFFQSHGSKIVDLHVDSNSDDTHFLDFCPNIAALSIHLSKPPAETILLANSPIASLTSLTLVIRGLGLDERASRVRLVGQRLHHAGPTIDKEELAKWNPFFAALPSRIHASLPSVTEIRIAKLVWPTTEHAIKKSPWVRWAEDMLNAAAPVLGGEKLQLVDSTGKKWRPRLQTQRGRG
ncbi:F-box domain-containing protein [Mycena kentingensis (nom. inval.)]|nr:F-box domain-containing protein [Mycena kentingensis (nom. inval.)]